jgi:hypothetical protein
MKKLSFSILLLFICQHVNAQILKGSVPASISLSFFSQHKVDPMYTNLTYRSSTNNYSINPKLGDFIADNVVLGLGAMYTYSNSKNTQESDTTSYTNQTTSHRLQFAPYLGYYIQLSDKFYFSITGSMGYQFTLAYHRTGTNLADDKEDKSYELRAALMPGITYFIHKKFALQASVGSIYYAYTHGKDFTNSYSDTNEGGLNFNLSTISLGVQYFLVKK